MPDNPHRLSRMNPRETPSAAPAAPPAAAEPLQAAAFWEEHCTECGEPACYRTCPKFARGPHGRCRRVDGFAESCAGTGRVRLRAWGKLELYFHGRLCTAAAAARLDRLDRRWRALRALAPRIYRSLRWRWALRGSVAGTPDVWRIRGTAARDETLVAAVIAPDLDEIARWTLPFRAGVESVFSLDLPKISDGFLLRLYALDGEATGEIDLVENRVFAAARQSAPFVKCLAWDLDGTLWDGTLEEDGEEALRARPEAVRLVKTLDARGIVNSIVSRNDGAKALSALRRLGLEEYFVFPQIGWGAKSAGLRRLAEELNVGLDALAFVDDRAEQRGEVQMNAPLVRVFAAEDVAALAAPACFNPPVCAAGAARRAAYRAEMLRRAATARDFGGDAAAFLAASGIELSYFDLADAAAEEWTRCAELLMRCNQLNLTGRHAGEGELRRLVGAPGARGWGVRCRDRYGDYGVVGVMVAVQTGADAWRLAEFAMSCRVAKKGCERRAVDWAKAALGARELSVEVVDTGRNAPLRAALEGAGA